MTSPRSEIIAGIKGMSPIFLGVAPFAIISGIVAVEAGLSAPLALAMSVFVFAGASQLAAVQLIGLSAAPLIIVLTAWIINLRFIMYSASLSPRLSHLPVRLKALVAYLITDQAYAVTIASYEREPGRPHRHWYYLGGAAVMWLVWQVCTLAGIFLGAQVPESWSLDFAVPLTFLALVMPAIKDRPAALAALTAGLAAVLLAGMPLNLGLISAAMLGIAAGFLVERFYSS